jgi:hypothetical protein
MRERAGERLMMHDGAAASIWVLVVLRLSHFLFLIFFSSDFCWAFAIPRFFFPRFYFFHG